MPAGPESYPRHIIPAPSPASGFNAHAGDKPDLTRRFVASFGACTLKAEVPQPGTIASLVGEVVTFTPIASAGVFVGMTLAAPDGSSPTWTGATFTGAFPPRGWVVRVSRDLSAHLALT